MSIQIIGTGECLPSKVVTNDDLSLLVDTSDEWIYSRTGIKQRHFCEEETNVELAVKAALNAMEEANIDKQQIGVCIVATFTSDDVMPSTACMVQKKIGLADDVIAFDLNAACSGFVYGLKVVESLLATNEKPYALLIGSEVISKVLDFTRRETCVLFGDGAGAVLLKQNPENFSKTVLGSDGNDEVLRCEGVGTEQQFITMQGQEVFRFAIDIIPKCIERVLEGTTYDLEDVDYFICHQANSRIIERVARKMKIDLSRFFVNVQNVGNTSSASIPIALAELVKQKRLSRGMNVMFVGFGAGLTWGVTLMNW